MSIEALEVPERRVAGAEVVERDLDSQLAQAVQVGRLDRAGVDENTLCDLEHERGAREPGLRQGGLDDLRKAGKLEL